MLYSDFRRQLETLSPIYWLEGEDEYWVGKAYKDLLALSDEMDRTIVTPLDDPMSALPALELFPFLGAYRVVVIRDVTPNADLKKELEAYAANPSPTSILVLYHTGWAPKGATACKFDYLTGSDLVAYVRGILAEWGIAEQEDAASLIAEYCEEDMQQVEGALVKLRAYLAGEPLTRAAVKAVVNPSITYKVYRFCDLVERGDYLACYRMIDALGTEGTDPASFLSILTNHYRMAFYGKITRLAPAELGKAMGGKKEFAAKKSIATAGKYTALSLLDVLKTLYQLEFDFKSGRTTSRQALELAVATAIERRNV